MPALMETLKTICMMKVLPLCTTLVSTVQDVATSSAGSTPQALVSSKVPIWRSVFQFNHFSVLLLFRKEAYDFVWFHTGG
jgi:hypothetical protein